MQPQKKALAIHDISCVGRCSLTVALPILSLGGINTSVLPTALLSTHTGEFPRYTYLDLTDELSKISHHWNGLQLSFDAIYTGFLGSFDQITCIEHLLDTIPASVIMVDPVMGDHGRLYTTYTEQMAIGMKRLCQKADIIVPNLTEAAHLLGRPWRDSYTQPEIEDMLQALSKLGPKQVVITGVSFAANEIGAVCYDRQTNSFSYAFAPKYDGIFYGTGDMFASALLAGLMNDFSLIYAMNAAIQFTHLAIKHSLELGQERRYGVCFEKALPYLMKKLQLL